MRLIALCLSAALLTACGTSTRELLIKADTELRIAEEKTRTIKAAAEYKRAAALAVAVETAQDEETRRTLIAADITRMAIEKIGSAESGKRAPLQLPPTVGEMLVGTFAGLLGKAADVGLAAYSIRRNADVSMASIGANRDIQLGAQKAESERFANAGATNAQIAAAGFNAGSLATTRGYESVSQIVATLGRPITADNGAVIVTGTNSGNAGQNNRLTSPDSTTTNCSSTTGAPNASPQSGAGAITLTMPPAAANTECKP